MIAFRRAAPDQTEWQILQSGFLPVTIPSTAEEWYLTVRCTNTACTRLIAFQKAIDCGSHSDLRLTVTVSRRSIARIAGLGCVFVLARSSVER